MVELLNVAMICRVQADVAQVVAHLIGSEEVTGPSPVISFFEKKNPENIRILFLCTRGGKEMRSFARPRPYSFFSTNFILSGISFFP